MEEVDLTQLNKVAMPANFEEIVRKWRKGKDRDDKLAQLLRSNKRKFPKLEIDTKGIQKYNKKLGVRRKWQLPKKSMR